VTDQPAVALHAGHDGSHCPVANYLNHLDAGDISGALESFTADASYTRPSLGPHEDGPQSVKGRDQLQALLVERGRKPWRHRIRLCIQDGPLVLVTGHVEHEGETVPRAQFISSATIDGGRIVSYVVLTASTPEVGGST